MTRYWVMRTGPQNDTPLLSEELLKKGLLRQGWGYSPDQDLNRIASSGKELSKDQRLSWRGNRRMLSTQRDGIQKGDLIVLPHLPERGRWSVVRVIGAYEYAIHDVRGDYGHILPVEPWTHRPVHPMEASAPLRQTMRTKCRLWNIDRLAVEVDKIVQVSKNGCSRRSIGYSQ